MLYNTHNEKEEEEYGSKFTCKPERRWSKRIMVVVSFLFFSAALFFSGETIFFSLSSSTFHVIYRRRVRDGSQERFDVSRALQRVFPSSFAQGKRECNDDDGVDWRRVCVSGSGFDGGEMIHDERCQSREEKQKENEYNFSSGFFSSSFERSSAHFACTMRLIASPVHC